MLVKEYLRLFFVIELSVAFRQWKYVPFTMGTTYKQMKVFLVNKTQNLKY